MKNQIIQEIAMKYTNFLRKHIKYHHFVQISSENLWGIKYTSSIYISMPSVGVA